MQKKPAEELIHGLNIRVHTTKDVINDEGFLSGTQSCVHIGHQSRRIILMHGAYIRMREFISNCSQRHLPRKKAWAQD
ncbi:MAG TPA: hypothetical protein VGK01_18380 [Candidatus Angelobacter sp.]